MCLGDCCRWREPFINGKPRLNILCPAYQEFFQYALDRFKDIVNKIEIEDFSNLIIKDKIP